MGPADPCSRACAPSGLALGAARAAQIASRRPGATAAPPAQQGARWHAAGCWHAAQGRSAGRVRSKIRRDRTEQKLARALTPPGGPGPVAAPAEAAAAAQLPRPPVVASRGGVWREAGDARRLRRLRWHLLHTTSLAAPSLAPTPYGGTTFFVRSEVPGPWHRAYSRAFSRRRLELCGSLITKKRGEAQRKLSAKPSEQSPERSQLQWQQATLRS